MVKRKYTSFGDMLQKATSNRSLAFSMLIVGALLAFEIFNYSTTDFALTDLLGDLRFAGMRWSTILALAFCGMDFAGIARIFTPEQGSDEPAEVWYLLGAWLLAAVMNALLTWWGVSIALVQHQSLGNAVIARETLIKGVPIFVAIMVWLSRVLIIGTFSIAGERLFAQVGVYNRTQSTSYKRTTTQNRSVPATNRSRTNQRYPRTQPSYSSFRPAPKQRNNEELYEQMPMVARPKDDSERWKYS